MTRTGENNGAGQDQQDSNEQANDRAPQNEANEELTELEDTGLSADELNALGDKGRAVLKAEREARKQANRALAQAKKDLKAFETRLATLEQKGMPELDQVKAQLTKAEEAAQDAVKRARERAGKAAVIDAAAKAGATSPEFIYMAVSGKLEYDDDDEPANVAALVAQAKKDAPGLFKVRDGGNDGGAGNGGARKTMTPNDEMNNAIRAALGRQR